MPDRCLINRTAVITGGSRGVGAACALALAERGANVAVIYANDASAAETVVAKAAAYSVKAAAYKCDVSDFNASKTVCDQIVAAFGGVDILVNNAGAVKDSLLLNMSESDFDRVVAVNLKGAFNFIRHLTRYLIKSPHGRVVNITSVSGTNGNPGQANYSAAKAGLVGLTKTAARELARKNVTVNAIAPGFVETDMTSGIPSDIIQNIPLKRMAKAEEVAMLVAYLVSDAAGYITGEIIKIDGGLFI